MGNKQSSSHSRMVYNYGKTLKYIERYFRIIKHYLNKSGQKYNIQIKARQSLRETNTGTLPYGTH